MRAILFATCWLVVTVLCGASERGGEAKITFVVKDESGASLSNVKVTLGTANLNGDVASVSGATDGRGVAVLALASRARQMAYAVSDIPGYYHDEGNRDFRFRAATNGKWEPYNPTVDITLKPIVNLVPMYVKWVKICRVPIIGQPIGYDLVVGDWVNPYGKGNVSDFVFSTKQDLTNGGGVFESTLKIAFSNRGDGIREFKVSKNQGSVLRLPRMAPEDGYSPVLERRLSRAGKDMPVVSSTEKDANYIFRVRTVMDKGEVVSANYGKIYGDIEWYSGGYVTFLYYLNPDPKSRNLECDVKGNLFKGEYVRRP